ncbi:glutathione S-transferase family protein [Loktanella sp. SALINAS62]|uniref:glutathione S-transferase family protein n=1 Tax=Loktanella sp. SALINAS62 TaxID=2706124 RepID=UPI001B8DAA52|nr:glutathione S-transferase family protein [Loktanella sp. SALINAS62]MBS1303914.1 glutathione S-transferase family protein [Loktanella sp. SALINAS62]
MDLTLHYAPDNASLCVRLALETLGVPYRTTLVDRATRAQRSPAYRALNPAGLIPVLETPDGPVFETAAILLWLSDRHPGNLLPDGKARGRALSWLFWLSNTLHPALRGTFYPDTYTPAPAGMIRAAMQAQVSAHLALIDAHTDALSPLHHCYLAPMLRWTALYGDNGDWFSIRDFPALQTLATVFEASPAAQRAAMAEGLGPTPFSAPRHAQPPEGTAT